MLGSLCRQVHSAHSLGQEEGRHRQQRKQRDPPHAEHRVQGVCTEARPGLLPGAPAQEHRRGAWPSLAIMHLCICFISGDDLDQLLHLDYSICPAATVAAVALDITGEAACHVVAACCLAVCAQTAAEVLMLAAGQHVGVPRHQQRRLQIWLCHEPGSLRWRCHVRSLSQSCSLFTPALTLHALVL